MSAALAVPSHHVPLVAGFGHGEMPHTGMKMSLDGCGSTWAWKSGCWKALHPPAVLPSQLSPFLSLVHLFYCLCTLSCLGQGSKGRGGASESCCLAAELEHRADLAAWKHSTHHTPNKTSFFPPGPFQGFEAEHLLSKGKA